MSSSRSSARMLISKAEAGRFMNPEIAFRMSGEASLGGQTDQRREKIFSQAG